MDEIHTFPRAEQPMQPPIQYQEPEQQSRFNLSRKTVLIAIGGFVGVLLVVGGILAANAKTRKDTSQTASQAAEARITSPVRKPTVYPTSFPDETPIPTQTIIVTTPAPTTNIQPTVTQKSVITIPPTK